MSQIQETVENFYLEKKHTQRNGSHFTIKLLKSTLENS